jgi:hypothetical protein
MLAWSGAARAAEHGPKSPTIADYASATTAPYAPEGGTKLEIKRCGDGHDSELEIEQTRALMPQHDVDLGRTKITLRHGKKIVAEARVSELWECLVYLPSTHRFVITSTNEHGTKVSLRALVFLDARDGSFADSVFDALEFEASSGKLGPDSRYLALIGVRSKNLSERSALFVLDLEADKLTKLGAAPAPPPFNDEERQWAREHSDAVYFMYGWDAPERSYVELPPEILRFTDATTLLVSYGKDSYRQRSTQRHIRRFALHTQ